MRAWLRRGQWWLLSMTSGSILVLEGCDPAVRESVLTGVNNAATSLATTFIGAFFQSLMNEEEETATTVRAVIDVAQQFFA